MPPGKGVNSYISVEKQSFQFLNYATKLIGKGYFIAKVDLRSVYRSVSVHRTSFRVELEASRLYDRFIYTPLYHRPGVLRRILCVSVSLFDKPFHHFSYFFSFVKFLFGKYNPFVASF